MMQPPPAVPGMFEEEVDTPALLVDLDALEWNLDRMVKLIAPTGVKLRPHSKTHKSPVIAHMQMARGAVGQCVQKVAEAEVMVWSGVHDVLVSNEVVGARKLGRLAGLARMGDVKVCADDASQVAALETAAADAGVRLKVLVEIDVGGGRCGIGAGEEAVSLARKIAGSRHLIFGGLQAYQGSAQHKRNYAERQSAVSGCVELTARTIEMLRAAGLECEIVGGGGTGTFMLEATSGVYTEIQAGSYVFMDVDYGRNSDETGAPFRTFRQSLFVLSTVMSAARPGVAVLDAGHKALSVDSGLPQVWERTGVTYVDPSCEHGLLAVAKEADAPRLGEKLRLVPGHCDPTVDRYDWYVGVRGGRVESVWPVAARGCGW